MLARLEGLGLFQRTADQEQERHDQAADQEGDAPAPFIHLRRCQRGMQDHAEQPGEDHRDLLAAGLPRDVEALAAGLGNLGQVDRHAAQLHARREALQQAPGQHQQRRGHADGGIARHAGNQQRAQRHQHQRHDQALAAAVAVDIRAQHDRAQRPHQEARAEGGERQHQRGKLIAAREERSGDGGGVEAVHHEVIHFEEVAADDAEHGAEPVLRTGGI
ncbi:hypothetical protein D3C72_1366400 [compost metagenome]